MVLIYKDKQVSITKKIQEILGQLSPLTIETYEEGNEA